MKIKFWYYDLENNYWCSYIGHGVILCGVLA